MRNQRYALALCSGARPKELRLAKVSDLDCSSWTFRIEHPKGEASYGERRRILILPLGRPLLKRYLAMRAKVIGSRCPLNEALFPAIYDDGDGFFATNGLQKLKRIVEKEVGFNFDLRACRRTFGQLNLDRGADVESVSIMLGHNTTKTTESYYCRKREDLALKEIGEIWGEGREQKFNSPLIEKKFPPSGYA